MNWSDLQILLAFDRAGTLKEAARHLGVNLSTVSRRLRALEEELGAPLVENISGRLTLTASGEEAVKAAEVMDAESNALVRAVTGREEEIRGVIRVGFVDFFMRFHSDLFSRFLDKYPMTQLEFSMTPTHFHNLARREADVVVRITRNPDETLVGRRVLDLEFAVYAHQSLLGKGAVDWKDLPWLGWDASARAIITETWMEKHVSPEQVRVRVDSPTAHVELAEKGVGACILPITYAEKVPSLERLSEPLEGFETSMWVLTHRDLRRNARVQAFMEHLYAGLTEFGVSAKRRGGSF